MRLVQLNSQQLLLLQNTGAGLTVDLLWIQCHNLVISHPGLKGSYGEHFRGPGVIMSVVEHTMSISVLPTPIPFGAVLLLQSTVCQPRWKEKKLQVQFCIWNTCKWQHRCDYGNKMKFALAALMPNEFTGVGDVIEKEKYIFQVKIIT